MPQSPAFLKRLRRKYGLGEFQARARKRRARRRARKDAAPRRRSQASPNVFRKSGF